MKRACFSTQTCTNKGIVQDSYNITQSNFVWIQKKLRAITPKAFNNFLMILGTMLLMQSFSPLKAQQAAIYQDWLTNPSSSKLIDYSYAGYHSGKSLPPKIEGPVFNVTDYGAIANDNKDDVNAIQKAVDAACRNGGGVVKFPAGTFDFDLNYPTENPNVRIWASNVVIRGAGSSKSTGTVLYDHKANDINSPTEGWTTVKLPNFFSFSSVDMHWAQELWYPNSQYSSTVSITTINPAARLSTVLTVADASQLKIGETYTITESDPDKSLVRAMSPGSPSYGSRPGATGTDYKAMKYRQIVRIVAISGNQITIDNPILMELKSIWSPTLWPTEHPVIREVGLEDMYLMMNIPQPFVHHDGAAADYGNHHVRFDWVEDGWMHNVVQEGATSAILLRDTKNCIVYDCSITGGEGHFGYQLCGTPSRNLFLNLYGSKQFHTFAIEGGAGNVFKNCTASDTAALDLHGNVFGIYNLFDNLTGCVGAGGGDAAQVPPNHGIGFTAWNWKMGTTSPYTKAPQNVYVDVTAYYAYNAPGFICAGVRAKDGHPVYYTDLSKVKQTANLDVNWGYNESNGTAVTPASLYDAQMSVRLNFNWCELKSPGIATVVAIGANVGIAADAGAASGKSVSKVEFFINGNSIGSDFSAPYTTSWNAGSNGLYILTAKMTASDNSSVTSLSRKIIVGSVNIIEDNNPLLTYSGGRIQSENHSAASGGTSVWVADGGEMSYSFHGTHVTIYTNLISGDGQNWTIYLDNVKVFGGALPAAVNRPNFKVWDSGELSDGNHSLRCSSENGGISIDYLTSVITGESSTNNPTVNITSPLNNATFTSGSPVSIAANASDSDGNITKVEFYQGSSKLGEDTSNPYSYSWTNVAAGNYSLTAKATDNSGLTTTSPAINIVVTAPATSYNIPGKVEAENYSAMNGIQTENTSDTGDGKNVGWIDVGDWMDYPINVTTAGTYTINYRIASLNGGGELKLQKGSTVYHTLAIPQTGTWQTWQTISANATLDAGQQTLRIYASKAGWNINWFEGVSSSNVAVTGVSVSPASTTIASGGTQQLTATVNPANATNKTVSWTTSNASVATVNASGLVTAVAAGSTTITVTTEDGNKTATSAITVTSSSIWGEKVEDTSTDIVYSGFTENDPYASFSGGTARWITNDGVADYTFTGTRIAVYTAFVQSWANDCKIYLDNMVTPVATWIKPNNNNIPDVMIWDSGILTDSTHKLRITKNNVGFDLDYLRVLKTATKSAFLNNESVATTATGTFLVYPNPASGFITIESDNDGETLVSIVNIHGKPFTSTKYNGKFKTNIDISTFPSGIYFINATSNKGKDTRKIVVR